ncbi:MAG: hypothetical protein HW412_2274 [Bacteroidetes bacterium]|nr:hypothetical protein [Bacteroidota bacterium]
MEITHNMRVRLMLKNLLVFCSCVATIYTTGFAATRQVPNVYPTISAAVAAATTGDTIRVYAGTYTEHVNISKSLVLIGSGPDTATIIAAPADFGSSSAYNYARPSFITERTIVHMGGSFVITVVMNGFTIDGMRLGPAISQAVTYSGILAERTNLTFSNNTIKNVLPADSSQTHDPGLMFNGRGITVRGDSSVATISNNTLLDINRLHIYVNATDTTTILPVVFPTATVSNNSITGKGLYDGAQKGIWFNNGAWGTISGNTITNMDYPNPVIESDRATGITVRRGSLNPAKRNLILNNTVTTTSHTNNKGIFVEGQRDSIADNTVSGFRFGIQLDDQDSAFVVRNTVTGGQIGIVVATTTIAPVAPYLITIGGSPSNKNTITGQDTSSIGAGIALSFRDVLADGTFMSTIPVDARYNDFGVYTESAIRNRIWDRADTTLISGNIVDTVYYSPFYVDKIRASVKVFLQGGGTLTAHFPSAQIPVLAVDSVNIEMRTAASAAASTTRKFAPAWLLSDGTIRNFSDTTKNYVEFDTTLTGDYYLVVRHRNHIAVMCTTAQRLDGSTSPTAIDFWSSLDKAYGTNPTILVDSSPTTVYAMYSGEVNGNGLINAADRTIVKNNTGVSGYNVADLNLNALVNAADRTIVKNNTGIQSQVP